MCVHSSKQKQKKRERVKENDVSIKSNNLASTYITRDKYIVIVLIECAVIIITDILWSNVIQWKEFVDSWWWSWHRTTIFRWFMRLLDIPLFLAGFQMDWKWFRSILSSTNIAFCKTWVIIRELNKYNWVIMFKVDLKRELFGGCIYECRINLFLKLNLNWGFSLHMRVLGLRIAGVGS